MIGHKITVEQGAQHVRVEKDGELLAESTRPVVLEETGSPTRYYLPLEDVVAAVEPSDHHSFCPFKGKASYYSVGGHADVAWYYPEPKRSVAAIKDLVAFWKADITVDPPR